jgi:hypothetical protein
MFTAGVVLMLLPIVAMVIGVPPEEPGSVALGGEPLFSPVEALFASFAFGSVLLLTGIAELQKSPLRYSLRTLLIAITLVAVVLGLIALAIKCCT